MVLELFVYFPSQVRCIALEKVLLRIGQLTVRRLLKLSVSWLRLEGVGKCVDGDRSVSSIVPQSSTSWAD